MRIGARIAVLVVLVALLSPAGGWAREKEVSHVGQSTISVPSDGTTITKNSKNSVLEVRQPNTAPKASLTDIEDEVMCTACGTLLELATESPVANRERDLIRHLIAQGLTKDQIKDRLVVEFGPNVLATPSTDGFDLTAWIVPGLAVVVAAIAIFLGLRRWRRETEERDDGNPPPSALSDEDAKRLDTDLGKYQL